MIYLFGEVDSQMAWEVHRRLDKNPKRANFMLNSIGGSLADGLAIYDRISALPWSNVTGTGTVGSAATIILQAAKVRRATPHTQFMVHLVRFDSLDENKQFKPHYDKILYHIYMKHISDSSFQWALRNKIFDVKDALRLGFIDEIWEGKTHAKPGLS